jgi:hypothetical protein
MVDFFSTFRPDSQPRWLAVVLSCMLCLVASFDLPVLAQVVGTSGPVHETRDVLEDDDEMILSRPSQRGRRTDRSPLDHLPSDSCLSSSNHSSGRLCGLGRCLGDLPRSEHARRNGVGVPLLC